MFIKSALFLTLIPGVFSGWRKCAKNRKAWKAKAKTCAADLVEANAKVAKLEVEQDELKDKCQICADEWSSPADGGTCGDVIKGCPSIPCTGSGKPWCCDDAECTSWFNCEPDDHTWKKCAAEWDGGCGSINKGCPSVACDGTDKPWCCDEDDAVACNKWHYCIPDDAN